MVRVQSSKNKYRTRSIPLSDTARWAVDRLLERAKEAGSVNPHHYLMPFRLSHTWHPDQAMTVSGIKKPWDAVRKAAGLVWFTPYGLRHTSLTRYAEAGTPISVLMSMAGHVSRKMMEHYQHISEQAKRKAVQSVTANSAIHHRHNASG
jgi:integrase